MDSEKVSAVFDWERPKTVKGLRGFLGLTGWQNCQALDRGTERKEGSVESRGGLYQIFNSPLT